MDEDRRCPGLRGVQGGIRAARQRSRPIARTRLACLAVGEADDHKPGELTDRRPGARCRSGHRCGGSFAGRPKAGL